jgi:hypothetical protein
MQEFFELRMGNMTMEEYEKKFAGMLKYVGIKDEGESTEVFEWISILL